MATWWFSWSSTSYICSRWAALASGIVSEIFCLPSLLGDYTSRTKLEYWCLSDKRLYTLYIIIHFIWVYRAPAKVNIRISNPASFGGHDFKRDPSETMLHFYKNPPHFRWRYAQKAPEQGLSHGHQKPRTGLWFEFRIWVCCVALNVRRCSFTVHRGFSSSCSPSAFARAQWALNTSEARAYDRNSSDRKRMKKGDASNAIGRSSHDVYLRSLKRLTSAEVFSNFQLFSTFVTYIHNDVILTGALSEPQCCSGLQAVGQPLFD